MNYFAAEKVLPSIQTIIEGAKVEEPETIEARVAFKGYDILREKRFNGEVVLPHPLRQRDRVLIIADSSLSTLLKGTDLQYVEAENFKGKDKDMKKTRKRLVKKYKAFIAVPSVYSVFEPKLFAGKRKPVFMIKNVNDIQSFYEDTKRKVQLVLKKDMLLGFPIGYTTMGADEVAQNFVQAMQALLALQKKGIQNIRSVNLKATKGKVIKFL